MKRYDRYQTLAATAAMALMLSDTAHAYVGPGAGLGVIGTLVAFVGAILLAIVGFVWYPIKRLLKKRKQPDLSAQEQQTRSAQAETEEGESISS